MIPSSLRNIKTVLLVFVKKTKILICLKLQSTMDIVSFEVKLIDFDEIDFYSDADEELIDIEETDLDLSDASDKKTLMD